MKSRFLLLSLIVLATFSLTAQKLTQTFSFDPPKFIEKYDGFAEPQMDNCFNTGQEGQPLMPLYSAEILLPQGQQIKNIEIISVTWSKEIQHIKIVPADRQFPISEPAPEGYRPSPDQDIYGSATQWPVQILTENSTQFLGGYSIGIIGIHPLEFNPAAQTAKYIREITIEIETEKVRNQAIRQGNNNALTQQRVENLVSNPSATKDYSFPSVRDQEVDLLIITKESYADFFETYIQFKTERGFVVELELVEDIYQNYPGDDDQEKIRNCIIDYYENHGLTYVILGGDADPNNQASRIVPHRGFYVDTGFGTIDDDIPSDMYYCCLDGTWDSNNNGNFGEPGEEDLYAEVIIGRMCVDSPTDLTNMISKLTKYQDQPVVQDIDKALMVGEALDETTWGGDSKDDVAYGSSNWGYTTEGLSDNFSVSRLYEKLGYWNKQDVFDQFNNTGCNLLNHLGHSSVDYNMKIYNSDLNISNFQNDGISRGYVIGYSQGCYNGAFDNRGSSGYYVGDCFSENITTLATAEVASIGNSRYGWYSGNTTNGASQYLDRQFYDAIFGEDMTQIGVANGDSREDNASYILNEPVIRWCAYEITLFGDPTMDIWTQQPTDIVASYPGALSIGVGEVSITTDAPFARIGLMQDGQLIGRGTADASGDLNVELFNPITTNEIIELYITAHNRNLFTGTMAVVTDEPYVIVQDFEINDVAGNNNGMADFGETILLGLSLENVGNQMAENVTVTLSSTDPYINLPYLAVDFGNLETGQIVTIDDAFEVIIAEDVPDLHNIEIDVNATGQDTWSSDFEIGCFAPVLAVTNVSIDDINGGNGNAMLDPGETAIISFTAMNQGHSLSPDIDMQLESLNEFVTIVTGSADCDPLQPNATGQMEFDIQVSSDAATGDIAELETTINYGEYIATKTFNFDIGVITENFETGDFSGHNWQFDGNADWEICNAEPWEGDFCVRSGAIGHNATSELKINVMILESDSVTFYRKVSSESGYDYLKFYVDNTLKGQWSGEEAWQKVSFSVPAGMHNLRWVYEKDQGSVNGDDCGWIDFIKFPTLAEPEIIAGEDGNICQGETFMPDASGSFVQGITWSTAGDGTFNNANMMKPTYTPGNQDIQDGGVMLSVEASGMSGGTVSDELMLNIYENPQVPPMPNGDVNPCTNYGITYDYTISGANPELDYIWELLPENAGQVEANGTSATITWTQDYQGTVELHVKSTNPCGESAFSQSLEMEAQICTGINEDEVTAINVSPNPTNGLINITLAGKETTAKVAVIDAYGRQILSKEITSESKIDLGTQPRGLYFIRIETLESIYLKKVVLE